MLAASLCLARTATTPTTTRLLLLLLLLLLFNRKILTCKEKTKAVDFILLGTISLVRLHCVSGNVIRQSNRLRATFRIVESGGTNEMCWVMASTSLRRIEHIRDFGGGCLERRAPERPKPVRFTSGGMMLNHQAQVTAESRLHLAGECVARHLRLLLSHSCPYRLRWHATLGSTQACGIRTACSLLQRGQRALSEVLVCHGCFRNLAADFAVWFGDSGCCPRRGGRYARVEYFSLVICQCRRRRSCSPKAAHHLDEIRTSGVAQVVSAWYRTLVVRAVLFNKVVEFFQASSFRLDLVWCLLLLKLLFFLQEFHLPYLLLLL